jgi:hypothetical protein
MDAMVSVADDQLGKDNRPLGVHGTVRDPVFLQIYMEIREGLVRCSLEQHKTVIYSSQQLNHLWHPCKIVCFKVRHLRMGDIDHHGQNLPSLD